MSNTEHPTKNYDADRQSRYVYRHAAQNSQESKDAQDAQRKAPGSARHAAVSESADKDTCAAGDRHTAGDRHVVVGRHTAEDKHAVEGRHVAEDKHATRGAGIKGEHVGRSAPAVNSRRGSEGRLAGRNSRPQVGKRVSSQRRANPLLTRVLPACLALGVLVLGVYFIFFSGSGPSEPGDTNGEAAAAAQEQIVQESTVSFVAVGDNLPEIEIAAYADDSLGEPGDGQYDYTPIYSAIKPYIEQADLAYINFETHAGGDDIGPRGYPSFNTTSTMVDAVFDTGFDLIASATNHSYDWAEQALVHSANLWKQKDVLFTGTAVSPEDAATIKTYEKDGIVFSLLNYTYGVNGYSEEEIPAYAVNYMHEDRITADIAAAREQSDVVIVAMHWGTEHQTEPDETQLYYAQLIADAGADLILGSHPHVIGPLAWLQGAGGNKTLVAYSLGNFLSNHELSTPLNELEGMLQCDFVKDAQGSVSIENVRWTPLVNHPEPGNFSIYALKDYTPELALRHPTLSTAGLTDPLAWLKETSAQIIGPDFTIDQ